jgi:hypothetical protein
MKKPRKRRQPSQRHMDDVSREMEKEYLRQTEPGGTVPGEREPAPPAMTESVQGPERLAALLDELSRVPPYRTNQEKAEWLLAHGVSLPDSGEPTYQELAAQSERDMQEIARLREELDSGDAPPSAIADVCEEALRYLGLPSDYAAKGDLRAAVAHAVEQLGSPEARSGDAPRAEPSEEAIGAARQVVYDACVRGDLRGYGYLDIDAAVRAAYAVDRASAPDGLRAAVQRFVDKFPPDVSGRDWSNIRLEEVAALRAALGSAPLSALSVQYLAGLIESAAWVEGPHGYNISPEQAEAWAAHILPYVQSAAVGSAPRVTPENR